MTWKGAELNSQKSIKNINSCFELAMWQPLHKASRNTT